MSEHSRQHNQAIAREMRKTGVELTPEEVAAHRKFAHDKLRKELRALGYEVPDGEQDMTAWMQSILGEEPTDAE